MRINPPLIALLVLLSVTASGCELIGDIIKLGIWVGVILVVVVVGLLYWIFSKLRNRG